MVTAASPARLPRARRVLLERVLGLACKGACRINEESLTLEHAARHILDVLALVLRGLSCRKDDRQLLALI